MRKGSIIYLNGVTSSGKTSIAKEIQRLAEVNIYHLSNDRFQDMVSAKYLHADYNRYLCEAIYLEYKTAKMFSDNGIHVVMDGMILNLPEFHLNYGMTHYELIRDLFFDSDFHMIEVYCPLDECRKRTLARGDREENQSEQQAAIMEQQVIYHGRVETHRHTAAECAENILKNVLPCVL